ncbi:MAG: metallophosphoesterase [Phycisphaeraceae bacterium]|nr:metallophosphoesterase [Phycisphaeraceae bacterium]
MRRCYPATPRRTVIAHSIFAPCFELHGAPKPNNVIMVCVRTGTLAIGDVHGCGEELAELLARCDRWYPEGRLIFVGDLFTKGPNPGLVARLIRERRDRGQRIDLVCGNHDLRLRDAIRRRAEGAHLDTLPETEAQTLKLLERADMLRTATDLTLEACGRVEIRDPRGCWTVLHAGIDPERGLVDTADHVKVHIKALEGMPHWWERYDGHEGLIVVGHKPLPDALIRRRESGEPFVAVIDTGCAYGGALTAYCLEDDRLIQVPSTQAPSNGFMGPPAALLASEPRSAWGALARTLAR